MSIFEKVEVNVCKKFILRGHRAKYQKNHSNVVSIIFLFLFEKQFKNKNSLPIIYNLGNE